MYQTGLVFRWQSVPVKNQTTKLDIFSLLPRKRLNLHIPWKLCLGPGINNCNVQNGHADFLVEIIDCRKLYAKFEINRTIISCLNQSYPLRTILLNKKIISYTEKTFQKHEKGLI